MIITRHRTLLPLLAAAGLALLAALAVFALLRGGGGPAPAAPRAASAPSGRSTTAAIARLQGEARAHPGSALVLATLGSAYLQRVRETGDPSFYARADGVLRRALRLDPRSPDALTAGGTLALARHDFRGALRLGEAARRAAPALVAPLGVVVDAQVELGRYGAAARTLQEMVDRKPDLASYARVSYFRELHGDLAGAEKAMRLAVTAGGGAPENVAYVQTLVGALAFARGDLAGAERASRSALAQDPGYVPAQAGLARVEAARGRLPRAIARLRGVVESLPLPQYAVALGETELAAGRVRAARRDLALVGAQERLLRAAGVDTDVDLALFEADHGSPGRAVTLARAAWAQAPSVRAADALGWSLTRAGRPAEGLRWARRALRLGSRDAAFLYHAGMAAARAGERGDARRLLRASLAGNPRWSPLYAPRARHALEALR
ncbi:tetratricopeptide repeat protein [Capillimicrobium parvum]|nr:tetratricopeptide repeat protein [Capillimicrobium parvum]